MSKSIVEFIGNYLPLTKSGPQWVGICPFHSDTKPSLHVDPERNVYKCFACGSSGDSVRFAMEYFGLPFKEAVARVGQESTSTFEVELRLLEEVKLAYRKHGTKSIHLERFLGERGITHQTAQDFDIGVAPDWDLVVPLIEKNPQFTMAMGLELGLIRETSSRYTDTFKNRIIFPISREDGSCVGFAGRATDHTQQPKYLNSRMSEVFKKSELLFGLHLTGEPIKTHGAAIVVEGFIDLITLYDKGVKNAVALMGTALTQKRIQTLQSHARHTILAFDSDKSGQLAQEKTAIDLLKSGQVVSFMNDH